jgi:uncharacterized RDD family membrane protein YckC
MADLSNPVTNIASTSSGASTLPARAIAAFVDYLVIFALCKALSSINLGYDFEFLLPLMVGAFYFSIGNSQVTLGQTLGKKAFGLKVISIDSPNQCLSIGASLIRFLFLYGLIILTAEVPKLIFRHFSISASPVLLELNMLIALCYFLSNIGLLILGVNHRGFHDLVCKSQVMRNIEINEADSKNKLTGNSNSAILGIVIGALFSFVVWNFGLSEDEDINHILADKYVIENQLPLRIIHVERQNQTLRLFCFSTEINSKENLTANNQELIIKMAQFLKNRENHQLSNFSEVIVTLYAENAVSDPTASIGQEIKFNPISMEIFEQKDI